MWPMLTAPGYVLSLDEDDMNDLLLFLNLCNGDLTIQIILCKEIHVMHIHIKNHVLERCLVLEKRQFIFSNGIVLKF